jgi:hypothetical protein
VDDLDLNLFLWLFRSAWKVWVENACKIQFSNHDYNFEGKYLLQTFIYLCKETKSFSEFILKVKYLCNFMATFWGGGGNWQKQIGREMFAFLLLF